MTKQELDNLDGKDALIRLETLMQFIPTYMHTVELQSRSKHDVLAFHVLAATVTYLCGQGLNEEYESIMTRTLVSMRDHDAETKRVFNTTISAIDMIYKHIRAKYQD